MVQSGLLLKTKFIRPILHTELIARQELFNYLDKNRQLPLILVSAPAGYGKTTLVNSYLQTVDWASIWLSLDDQDNDLKLFCHFFVAAIQSVFPEACKATEELLKSADLPSVEALANSLAGDIDLIPQDFILVLDDYSRIHVMEVHDLLSRLLRHPPHSIHFIITTRRDPLLPLVNLRAQRQMAEIRVPELRFSLAEAGLLLRNILGANVDDKMINAIQERTEGWVIGLYLVAISFRNCDVQLIHKGPSENDNSINEYLLSEVYTRIPVAIQDFLLRISILDRFCASLCDSLSRENNDTQPLISGIQCMDWTKNENLFLFACDIEQGWFKLHPLFRTFLQRQLKDRYNPEEINIFHSKACHWFSQNQLFAEALQNALAADDINTSIQLVGHFNQTIRLPDQWPQLNYMVQLFPVEILESNPDLLLAQAWVMCTRFLLGKIPAILEKTEKLLSTNNPETSRQNILIGEVAALRSHISFWSGDYKNANIQGRKALEALPEEWRYIRDITSIQTITASQILETESPYTASAEEQFKLILNNRGTGPTPLNEQIRLCFMHWLNADLHSLKFSANKVLSENINNDLGIYQGMGHYFLGIVCYYQNDLIQAEQHFKTAWQMIQSSNALFLSQSSFGLASVYAAQGHFYKAYEIVNTTAAYLLEMKDPRVIQLVQAFQAELAISQNDLITAKQWQDHFNSLLLPPAMTFFYPHFTLLKILLTEGTPENRKLASDILSQLRRFVETTHNKDFLIKILTLESWLLKSSGDEAASLDRLKQAFYLAKPGGIIRPIIDLFPGISVLLPKMDQSDPFIEKVSEALMDEIPSMSMANNKLVVPLTDRELKVLGLLAKRLSNKEIATELNISTGTVKSHTIRIYQKLNINSRHEAVVKAYSLGVINTGVDSYHLQ
jgi:LuxR family transcriptional regulator, maltose regulon positive regulatory protein